MRHPSLLAVALALAAAAPAFATERLTDAQFLRASQCLAHVEASESDAPETLAFAAAMDAQDHGRAPHLMQSVREDARAIARLWRRADTAEEQAGLTERKAVACAGFEALRAPAAS